MVLSSHAFVAGPALLCRRARRSTRSPHPPMCVNGNSPPTTSNLSPSASRRPLVPILMGSASDAKFASRIAAALESFGIDAETRVASAHKVPARLLEVLSAYERDPRPKVYVAVAGRSNALSGMLDCAVSAPVISCPPYSDAFGGADVFSSIRMPSGVAPALVLDPAAAALTAAKILGLYDSEINEKVCALQKANRDRLRIDDAQALSQAAAGAIAAIRENSRTLINTDAKLVFGTDAASEAVRSGKVRDQYKFTAPDGQRAVALVTTDRQSAFDRVLAAVPYKGAVLNLVSAWWFRRTQHIVPNHVIEIPHPNVTIARECTPFPVEFVVRGYITGSTETSLWRNYLSGKREYCGIEFPDGLRKNQRLDSAVLTPTTKEDAGDRPISPAEVLAEGIMSEADWRVCANAAMDLFAYGQRVAAENGLILVDTKYEFGKDADGTIRLIDEIHTPDSSRYWIATSYENRMATGAEPENIDKEFLRLWFRDNCDPYDKSAKLPMAPDDLVDELSRRYIMLYDLITGTSLDLEEAAAGPQEIANALRPFVAPMQASAR